MLTFVESTLFTSLVHEYLSDDEYAALQQALTDNPEADDVTYSYESLVSAHANLTTIGGHLVYGDDDEWAVSVDSSQTPDNVAVTPVLHTVHLAHYVFKAFGLNGDAMDPFVADLVVPASAQEQEGN